MRATAKDETPFGISEEGKLRDFAGRLGIDNNGDVNNFALKLCDFVEADFTKSQPSPRPSRSGQAPPTSGGTSASTPHVRAGK